MPHEVGSLASSVCWMKECASRGWFPDITYMPAPPPHKTLGCVILVPSRSDAPGNVNFISESLGSGRGLQQKFRAGFSRLRQKWNRSGSTPDPVIHHRKQACVCSHKFPQPLPKARIIFPGEHFLSQITTAGAEPNAATHPQASGGPMGTC